MTADAIVVGAGVVGTSTALELSRSGYTCVVVDKAGGPGHGSTSASSGIVRFNYSTWDGMAAAWESKFRWEAWADHLGARSGDGLAKFIRCGFAFLDVEIMPREKMEAMFGEAGIPFESWGTDELKVAFPGIDAGRYYPPKPVTSEEFFADSTETLGAVFTPDAGYVDDPRLAAANLATAAVHHGVKFVYRRTVGAIRRVGNDWEVTLDDGQHLQAPILVNAAGPWSSRLNALAGVGEDFTITVAPMRQEVHHVPAPRRLGGSFPVIGDADLGVYIRPDSGGHMLIGGTEPDCDPLEWIEDPDVASPRPTAERFEAQVWRAARRLPELTVPNRPRGVAGVYDAASDWTPIYDRTSEDGFFVAMGTSGNQFKNAPLIGSLMSTLIDGVMAGHDHDVEPIQFRAPHSGHLINLGAFSRRRSPNADSSGTVFG